tara:strand:- start:197 stop:346 length:150 start_codon:yes stop_codon:yes gene_type:complete
MVRGLFQGTGGQKTPVVDTDDPADTFKSWIWKKGLTAVVIVIVTGLVRV